VSRYYDFLDEKEIPGRWYLKVPIGPAGWVNPEQFVSGTGPVNPEGPLKIGFRRPGDPLDYTMADRGMPVASERAAAVFREIAGKDVELVPLEVEGRSEQYYIVNAIRTADCVDEVRSEEVSRFGPEDGRPDLLGEYRSIRLLRIDPSRTGGLDIFRVRKFEVALIVSERLKEALERANLTGLYFKPV